MAKEEHNKKENRPLRTIAIGCIVVAMFFLLAGTFSWYDKQPNPYFYPQEERIRPQYIEINQRGWTTPAITVGLDENIGFDVLDPVWVSIRLDSGKIIMQPPPRTRGWKSINDLAGKNEDGSQKEVVSRTWEFKIPSEVYSRLPSGRLKYVITKK